MPSRIGAIVSVRGSVVDACFEQGLPPINSLLTAGPDQRIVIEVWSQLSATVVRGIALNPTQGLARGMAVTNTGHPLRAPVGKAILSRMFDVFGRVIDRGSPLENVEWRSVHRLPPYMFFTPIRRIALYRAENVCASVCVTSGHISSAFIS